MARCCGQLGTASSDVGNGGVDNIACREQATISGLDQPEKWGQKPEFQTSQVGPIPDPLQIHPVLLPCKPDGRPSEAGDPGDPGVATSDVKDDVQSLTPDGCLPVVGSSSLACYGRVTLPSSVLILG